MAKGSKPTYDMKLLEELRSGLETITPERKQKLTTPELINQLGDVLRQKLNDGCTWEQLVDFLSTKGVDIKVTRLKTLLPRRPGSKKKRQGRRAQQPAQGQPNTENPTDNEPSDAQ